MLPEIVYCPIASYMSRCTVGRLGMPKFGSARFSRVFPRTLNQNRVLGDRVARTANQNRENRVQQVRFWFGPGSNLEPHPLGSVPCAVAYSIHWRLTNKNFCRVLHIEKLGDVGQVGLSVNSECAAGVWEHPKALTSEPFGDASEPPRLRLKRLDRGCETRLFGCGKHV